MTKPQPASPNDRDDDTTDVPIPTAAPNTDGPDPIDQPPDSDGHGDAASPDTDEFGGRPHGLYHGRGWTVDVGVDANDVSVTIASMHEAMHERLQVTTIHGGVVILLQRLAAHDPDGPWHARASAVQAGSRSIHEQFATWMSAVPAAWDRSRIAHAFPRYLRHFDRAAGRVSAIGNPYLMMHATQAVARACMQPAALAVRAGDDITAVTPATLDRTMRPDYRLHVLDRLLDQHGFGPLTDYRGSSADIGLARFADDNDREWALLSEQAYLWCATLLTEAGLPTLPYDGHRDAVRTATEAAAVHAREPLGVGTERDEPEASIHTALFAVESERTTLGAPLTAVVHPPGTDPNVMLAGDADRAHLFLAIRPRRRLLMQYDLPDTAFQDRDHLAVLRCSSDAGVELLDVTDVPPDALTSGRAVITSMSMRSLADEPTRRQWAPLLAQTNTTVLADLRPSQHIPLWLTDPALRLRWTIFGTGTPKGTVRVLAFRLQHDDGPTSRLHLSFVSGLYAAGFELWAAEAPTVKARAERDDTLATDQPMASLIRFSVAHLSTEERQFDFHAGETHD